MPANRRRRTAALVAAVTLTVGLVAGCDPADSSLDCLGNYDTIADSLKAIHEAGLDAASDPAKTDESIEQNLDEIGRFDDETHDSKVGKAVDRLDKAISGYNKAILNGDTNPDSSKIDAAADDLKDVCTS